jgi:hypothetical protein
MQITMDMVSGIIEGDSSDNKNEKAAELLYANWNPQLALMTVQEAKETTTTRSLPASLADVDIDAFLRQMYINQEG